VPRTWAKVAPPGAVHITVTEERDDTEMIEAVLVESAAPEGESAPSQGQWKIRMKNPSDAKPPEPAYHDLPWPFANRDAAEAAILEWKKGGIDPDEHA
jgi:hypothetical protein